MDTPTRGPVHVMGDGIVGRRRELDTLWAWLGAACEGAGRLVLCVEELILTCADAVLAAVTGLRWTTGWHARVPPCSSSGGTFPAAARPVARQVDNVCLRVDAQHNVPDGGPSPLNYELKQFVPVRRRIRHDCRQQLGPTSTRSSLICSFHQLVQSAIDRQRPGHSRGLGHGAVGILVRLHAHAMIGIIHAAQLPGVSLGLLCIKELCFS